MRQAPEFRPGGQVQRLTVVGEQPRIAPVAGLGLPVSPAAVVGAVGKFIVETVQRIPGRTRPHVLKERLEGIEPAVTHRYPAPAIVPVVPARVGVATAEHCRPGGVLSGISHSVVIRVPPPGAMAAVLRPLQNAASGNSRLTAGAPAEPVRSGWSSPHVSEAQDRQLSKLTPGQVLEPGVCWHVAHGTSVYRDASRDGIYLMIVAARDGGKRRQRRRRNPSQQVPGAKELLACHSPQIPARFP